MNGTEKNLVKLVAKIAPWLAPFPSAYFVARSAMAHLALPLWVAVIVAAIIETLGLATVHTALWAYEWNAHKRKTDPDAPMILAVALGAVYIVATWGLVVFLEVWPSLATYAPAIFPILAVVGAVNLALIARQELREAAVKAEKAQRKAAREVHRDTAHPVHKNAAQDVRVGAQESARNTVLDAVNRTRRERKAALLCALLDAYEGNPDLGATDAARLLGVHRNTVYSYTAELQATGKLGKNGDGWEVRR